DFGLACGTAEDGRLTQAGSVIGTPSYMAPEQANAEEVDARSDLFSLGSVLYQASTGRLPFGGKDTLSVLSALANKTPTPPHKIVPSLPPAFSDLVMSLLSKRRDDRPQSGEEVIERIEAIEQGEEPGVEFEVVEEEEAAPAPVRSDVRKKSAVAAPAPVV